MERLEEYHAGPAPQHQRLLHQTVSSSVCEEDVRLVTPKKHRAQEP